MKVLVNVLFWSIFAVTAPVGVVIGTLLAVATAPFDADRRLIHSFICRFVFSYLRLNPLWRVRVNGRELISNRPSVLVANHQSMADIVACMGLFRQYKFVSKVSLFSLPLVGWMMRLAKYVRLERGSMRSTQRMLERCRFWLRRGISILFFPEGTYGSGGELLPFKRGAFLLAIQERVPLIPILIEGTPSLVIEDGPWFNPRCSISVSVLPPIEPSQLGESEADLAQRVRVLLEQGLRHSRGAETRNTG